MRRGPAIVAVAVVLLAVLVVRRDGSGPQLLAPADSIAGYKVVYRVEAYAQGTEVSRREIGVRRPAASSDLTYPEGATEPVSGFVSTGSQLFGKNGDATLDYGGLPVLAAPGDYRLGPVIADLQRLGLARKRGAKRIAGRSCTEYRFGAPLGDPIKAQEDGEHADLCIDGVGLVLLERWSLNGRRLRETKAVHVDLTPPPPASFIPPPGDVKPNPSGVSTVTRLSTDQLPETGLPHWVAREPMWGFALSSRLRATTTSAASGSVQVSDILYVDSYVRGHDAFEVLHRELSSSGPPAPGAERVHAGKLGAGEVSFGVSGASISFAAGKWVVTVRGPFDVARLRAFAAGLESRGPR